MILMAYLPFRDSTEILHDGLKLSERLDTDGYLFIKGLLPRDDILKVRGDLFNIAQEYAWLDQNEALIEGIVNRSFDAATFRQTSLLAINRMWCDESIHRIRLHQNILSLFERMFNEPVLSHPKFLLRHFFPNTSPTQSHQDRVHVGGGRFCTLWVPLGDCPVEQGVLAIASGSHNKGDLKAAFGGMGIIEDPSMVWIAGPMNAGDVLLFSNTTVHTRVRQFDPLGFRQTM
jgi:ectoine hydroxylase-related dioxygenase (phytanoyl-CoA dioxygenase family)